MWVVKKHKDATVFWLLSVLLQPMLTVAPEGGRGAGLFTMQTPSHHHAGEKSSEGECGKQSNVISVP